MKTIIDASRGLFLAQGYRQTTIRQIIDQVGIKNGTLYHFFKDKEDIFCHVCMKTYDAFIAYVDGVTEDTDGPLKYAMTRALEFKLVEEDEMIARLYEEAYSSWRVAEAMIPVNMKRNRRFFHRYNPAFTDDDYRYRTVALRGMRALLISDRIHTGKGRFDVWCPFAIETALSLFHVPESDIARAVTRTLALITDHDIAGMLDGRDPGAALWV
jgi:AcrR family transcriptional regulator